MQTWSEGREPPRIGADTAYASMASLASPQNLTRAYSCLGPWPHKEDTSSFLPCHCPLIVRVYVIFWKDFYNFFASRTQLSVCKFSSASKLCLGLKWNLCFWVSRVLGKFVFQHVSAGGPLWCPLMWHLIESSQRAMTGSQSLSETLGLI